MEGMFAGAKAFNQPLSTFDTAEVTDVSVCLCEVQTAMRDQILTISILLYYQMAFMFNMAQAFDQNLCHFKDNSITFPQNFYMFLGSDCPDNSDPGSASGPWCYTCS